MYFRLVRPEDFSSCTALLSPAFKVSPRIRAALPVLWSRLLTAGQLNGGVVIDPGANGAQSIAAFGMSAFVDDAFVEDHAAAPRPYLSARIYQRLLSGD